MTEAKAKNQVKHKKQSYQQSYQKNHQKNIQKNYLWQRKSFVYLVLAALTVSWTGFSFKASCDLTAFILVSLITVFLVLFVYGLDDYMDEVPAGANSDAHLRAKALMRGPLILFATLALLCSGIFLAPPGRIAAGLIVINGFIYTYKFNNKFFRIRLKSTLFLKNIMIGCGWGLLIFLGYNERPNEVIITGGMFLTIQVVIGSILRDFDDTAEDHLNEVKTLPLVMGWDFSFLSLHLLNFLSLAVLGAGIFWQSARHELWAFWLFAVLYRLGLIEWIRQCQIKQKQKSFYLQQMNLFTCGLIFILRMLQLWIS